MDIWALRVFKTVAEEGSISAAAARLHCVQSNVTARIRQLEEELGSQLFYRKHRGVTLTAKGKRLTSYAEKAIRIVHEAELAVVSDSPPQGPLTLGSMESTAATRLPLLLSKYHRLYPLVQLDVETGTTEALVNKVLSYALEGAFVAGPVEHPHILQYPAFEEQLVIITEQGVSSLRDLALPTFIAFKRGCSYRNVLESWARETGVVPGRFMELGTLEGILGFVAAGMGVTLLPSSVVENLRWQNEVRVHTIPAQLGATTTVFIHRTDGIATGARESLIDLMTKTYSSTK